MTSERACFDYNREIQPLLERACLDCHGPTLAEGDYSVADAAHTFARRPADGVARIEASNDALFLAAARGANDHSLADPADLAVLERWLAECQSNTLGSEAVHPRGWLNRHSIDFHGAALESSGWDFDTCSECHGDPNKADGGATGLACTKCHSQGATACSTCHGVPESQGAPGPALDSSTSPTSRGVGAHRLHQTGRLLAPFVQCEDCHLVPTRWDDPGHIFEDDGSIDAPPAEVVLNAAAGRIFEAFETRRTAEPSYDPATGTCNDVYCHGAVLGDTTYRPPVWTEISADPGCDICHGLPPGGTHATDVGPADCINCHPLVVGEPTSSNTFEVVGEGPHIHGELSLGDGSDDCSLCHGSPINSAPPLGSGGESNTTDPGVGAHQAHVAASKFRGPIPCNECHVVPSGADYLATVLAPGHIDPQPSEVFAGDYWGASRSDGAIPGYTRPNCTNIYCHGGGNGLAADVGSGIVRTLDWTDVGNNTIVCGSCHALPPQTPRHPWAVMPGVPMTVTDCAACHDRAVDSSGNIIFQPDGLSTHIDGDLW